MARTGLRKGNDAIATGTIIGLSIALLSSGINALGGHAPFSLSPLTSSSTIVRGPDAGPIAAAWLTPPSHDADLAADHKADAFSEMTGAPHRHASSAIDADARWLGALRQPMQ